MARTKRHNREERQSWAERWHASGLSGREFAKKNGLKAESVYRWGKEFPGEQVTGSRKTSAFTEVRVGQAEPNLDEPIELALKNDRVLRVPPGTDAAYVRTLVEALES